MKYRFSKFEIDCKLFELRDDKKLIHVEPKVFTLLQYLVENPDKIITTDELVKTVWKGRVVSDAAVMSAIANARKALGDSGSKQQYIKTVRGRGIRFTADIQAIDLHKHTDKVPVFDADVPDSEQVAITSNGNEGQLIADPVMLIIPFRTTSQNPTDEEFVQSLCTSLEIVLMRIPLLKMKSYSLLSISNSDKPSEIIIQSGADFVLDGIVQTQGKHIVVQAQLSDAKNGIQLWAEHFKIQGNYLSALEPCVVQLIKRLELQLHRAMYDRAKQHAGKKDSRLLYLEASSLLALKGWHHDSFTTAAELLRASWDADPEFAHASSYLSLVLSLGLRLGLLSPDSGTLEEAVAAAESALSIDALDSRILGLVGCAFGDIGRIDQAIPLLRNAVELNQQNAQALSALGAVLLTTRELDEAIRYLSEGIRISPLDSRLSIWGGLLSTALRFKGNFKQALKEAELACQRDHRAYIPRIVLAGTHYEMGNENEALAALKEARRVKQTLNELQIVSVLGKRLGAQLINLQT